MRQIRFDADTSELLRRLQRVPIGELFCLSDGGQDLVLRRLASKRWTRPMILGQAAADRLALMYDADVPAAVSRMNGSDLRVHVFPADTGEQLYMVRLPGETSWHVPGCGTLDDHGLIHELRSRGLSTRATVSALDSRW